MSGTPSSADVPDQPVVEHDGHDAGPAFVVGIGASAGGLQALRTFFGLTQPSPDLAYVVVQHLSPDHKSLMPELLSRSTPLPVLTAEEGMILQSGHIYLIPSRQEMTLRRGRLHLTERPASRYHHLPIDTFLLSLAEEYGDASVAVILSGAGSDGTRGIRAIKDTGGVVLVQDPEQAEFPGMPNNALATGLVDSVLPVEKLPQALADLTRPGGRSADIPSASVPDGQQAALLRIIATVRNETGMDFTHYKQPTILRRLHRRMTVNQVDSFNQYAEFLQTSSREVHALRNEMLIGVTRFFRDPESFEVIQSDVLPMLFEETRQRPVRVWVAGCYTGEEAYSLAMLLQEYVEDHNLDANFQLFATDVDQAAIDRAREGVYPASIVGDVAGERIERFFTRSRDHFRVVNELRRKVTFAPHNVIKDPPFSNMDMVSCRNLLIYIEPQAQYRILAMIGHVLNVGGFLFLGPSETPGELARQFSTVNQRWKVFRKKHQDEKFLGQFLNSMTGDRSPRQPQPLLHQPAPARQGNEQSLFRQALQEILLSSDAGCLILDEEFRVLQSFGHISQFVQFRSGEASLDIRKLATPDLAGALSSALLQARAKNSDTHLKGLHIRDADLWIDLRIHRLVDDDQRDLYLLLLENPRRQPAFGEDATSSREDMLLERIGDLEHQLDMTRQGLKTSMQEAQVTREEMQTTNEELMTSNEELQSTNEELQSVNEELHTVNAELQAKIRELNQLNDDMSNLFRVTEIGTIFLDRELAIRRFTPKATELLNLLPHDIGRPIDNITGQLTRVPLVDLARKVLETGQSTEWESLEVDGQEYVLRFVPYRTDSNRIEGVVITFVDLSTARRAERLQSLIDALPVAVYLVNHEGRIVQSNRSAEGQPEHDQPELFASLKPDDNLLHALRQQADSCPHARRTAQALADILEGTRSQEACEWQCPADPQHRWLYLYIRRFDAPHPAAVITVNDITELKTGQEASARLAQIVHDAQDAIIGKTLDGTITSWNAAAETIYGYSAEEAIGQHISLLAPDSRQDDIPQILDDLRQGQGVSHYKTLRKTKAGQLIYVSLTVSPIRDADGNIIAAASIARPLETKR